MHSNNEVIVANKVTKTSAASRYSLSDVQDDLLWVTDNEPWRRCWSCDARKGQPSHEFCGECGARFTPRRYRAEFHTSSQSGMLLELYKNSKITGNLLLLPEMYETLETAQGVVVMAKPIEGSTYAPLSAHDGLLLARAMCRGARDLLRAGYQLGRLNPADVVFQIDGSVALRAAPQLSAVNAAETAILQQLIDVLSSFVEVPRITRRFDIADADVNPLLIIIGDVRAGIVTTLDDCCVRVETALVPYESRRWMRMIVAAASENGRKRTSNEDSVLMYNTTWLRDGNNYAVGLYGVADGMGGHAAGEVASATAIQALFEHLVAGNVASLSNPHFASDVAGVVQCIDDAMQFSNTRVIQEAQRLGNNMGTTLTMTLVLGDVAYIANIGDSRTYLWRDDQLRRITSDHSLVMKLVELEHIAEDEIYTHPHRNGVLKSLGVASVAEVDIYVERLRPNDVVMLCSDGLWELVRDHDIATMFRHSTNPDTVVKALVTAANKAGGDDNISVVLVRCESDGR